MRTWRSHAEMVRDLAKKGFEIKEGLNSNQIDVWHAATGIATEAGELLSAAKAYAIYNRAIDRRNIIEELGDLEFYMEQLRQALLISRDETLSANMHKLGVRYADGYSDLAANERVDKKQEERG